MFTKKQISLFSIPLLICGVILFSFPKGIITLIAFWVGILSLLVLWLGNYKPKKGFAVLWKINRFLNKRKA